jgi:acyl-CoA synthetase (NDP forming)
MVLNLTHETFRIGDRISEIWSEEMYKCFREGIAAYPDLPRAARALSNLVAYAERTKEV